MVSVVMDKLRDFLQSWPGRILMLMCLAPMVLLGLEGYFQHGRLTADQIAKVGDTPIMVGALQDEINSTRARLSAGVDASLIDEKALADETLKVMIDRALLEEQAGALGMQVSDALITSLLQRDPAFLDVNGQFSNDLFARYLQSQNLTKDRLFASQRRQLNIRTLMNGILSTAIYPSSQIDRLLDLQFESRELWVKRLFWEKYRDQVTLSDDEIKQYYEANKDSLVLPNRVDLSYIELSAETVAGEVSEEDLKAAYQAYLRTNNLGQKQLAQILLTGDNVKKLGELEAKLKEGASFEELAKTYSDDPTGKSGGAIGSYNPAIFGNDATKVESAIATLNKGEHSAAVETAFGVHIFKVLGADEAPSFESLKDTLSAQVAKDKQTLALRERIAAINALVADGFGLKDIAEQMGMTVKTLPNYQDKDQAVMGQPAIIRAAFDETTLAEGGVSANIEVAEATLWVQPSNYRAAAPMSFEEAKSVVQEKLIREKATELALKDAEAQAKALGEAFARDKLADFTAVGIANRQTAVLNGDEQGSLFVHEASKDKPAVWAIKTEHGASVMVGGEIGTEAKARLTPEQKQQTALMIKNVVAQDHLEDYLHHLRQTHSVQMNEEVLKTLVR